VPDEGRTTWAPGVQGGIPEHLTICASVSAASSGGGLVDASAAIRAAIAACPAGQTVSLSAGIFVVNSHLVIDKGIGAHRSGVGVVDLGLRPGRLPAPQSALGMGRRSIPVIAHLVQPVRPAPERDQGSGASHRSARASKIRPWRVVRDGNFDYVSSQVRWDRPARPLPAMLRAATLRPVGPPAPPWCRSARTSLR